LVERELNRQDSIAAIFGNRGNTGNLKIDREDGQARL
jgi:hypothetical protein